MTHDNFQFKIGSTASTALQADSVPSAVADPNGRPGWLYKKVMAAEKFNWYFYSGSFENMKMKNVQSMFFCGSIDAWTNVSNEAPFFIIYTKMKFDGTDAGAFYHSKHAYTLHLGSQLVRAGEKCLFFCLQEPVEDFGGARKIPFRNRIDTGAHDPEDEVLYMTLQSDSGATSQSTYVEFLGADMSAFDRRIADNHINMKLIS